MQVLVTRPLSGAALTADRLRALGHQALLSPVSVLRPIDAPLPTGPMNAVVVSSANALRVLAPDLLVQLRTLPVFTVGVATAQTARALALEATAGPGTAAELPAVIARRFSGPANLLYLAGEPRKPDLEQALSAAGFGLTLHLCYRMEPATALSEAACAALAQGGVDAVLHFSRESAVRFSALAVESGCADPARAARHLCMSADVVTGLQALNPADVRVSALPTEESLLRLLDKGD